LRPDLHEGRDEELELGATGDAGPTPEGPSAPPEGAAAGGDPAAADASSEVDYKDRWLRAEAELQTFRRRARRELDDVRRTAEESVLLDLVAWLDDLERAIQAAAGGGASPGWVEGVSLVLQKGREYLERQGVTAVDPAGQPFDPAHHEAILEVDAPEGVPAGCVVQVIQRGYRRGTRSLRAARVVVARVPGGRE
jgi:molecular chaperone GrpE